MADGPTHLLEVEVGRAEPPHLPMTAGVEIAPFTVGARGVVRLEAPGVLDVHAFFYFDGEALFVQSADERSPVVVEGVAAPRAWTELAPPCRIALGGASLVFRARAAAPAFVPAPAPSAPARPPSLFPRPTDDESTRIGVPALTRGVRPAAGMPPAMSGGFGSVPTAPHAPTGAFGAAPMGTGGYGMSPSAPPMPMPMQGQAPPAPTPVDASPVAGAMAAWNGLPPIRKVLVVLLPFAFAAGIYMLVAEPGGPGPATTAPSATASTPPAPTPTIPPAVVVPVTPTVPTSVGAAPPTSSAEAAPSKPLGPGDRTLERQAIDAVASGDQAKAARLYAQLAAAHPENRVWVEAVRILHARLDGGAPRE